MSNIPASAQLVSTIAYEIRNRIITRQEELPSFDTAPPFFEGQASGMEMAVEVIDDFIEEVNNVPRD